MERFRFDFGCIKCLYNLSNRLCFFCQGFLKLSVWLCANPKCMDGDFKSTTEEETEEVAMVGKGDCQPPGCSGDGAEFKNVGQVEISDEATVDDLKIQVERLTV